MSAFGGKADIGCLSSGCLFLTDSCWQRITCGVMEQCVRAGKMCTESDPEFCVGDPLFVFSVWTRRLSRTAASFLLWPTLLLLTALLFLLLLSLSALLFLLLLALLLLLLLLLLLAALLFLLLLAL